MAINITQRERGLITLACVVAFALFAWLGVYEPAMENRETLKRKISSKTKELAEVTALARRVVTIKSRFDRLGARLKTRPAGLSSLTVIEELAGRAGMKERITSMSPQAPDTIEAYTQTSLDIKIEKVSLGQLKHFLTLVRDSENIFRIKRIAIKTRFEDAQALDVNISLAGYELSQ